MTVTTATRSRQRTAFKLYSIASAMRFHVGVLILFLLDRGLSLFQVGALQATLFIFLFALEYPTGVVADRLGRRRTVLAGQLITGLGLVLHLVPNSFWGFMIVMLLSACGMAATSGADIALFIDADGDPSQETIVFVRSRMVALSGLGGFASVLAGGLLAPHWALIFGLSAVGTVVAGLAVLVVPADAPWAAPPADEPSAAEAAGGGASAGGGRLVTLKAHARMVGVFALAIPCLHGALTPLIIFAQPALGESGLEPWLVAVVIGSVELGSSVMSYAADSLSGRFGLSRLTWAGGLALIGALLLGAFSLPWGFPLFALLLVGAELASFGLDVSVQERVPASDRASATSLVSALESLAIGSAYLLTGALAEGVGLGGTFLLLCLGPCVSLAAFRRRRAIPALAPA